MSRLEKTTIQHLNLRRKFDLWWWEFEEDGKNHILQEDLMAYSKLEFYLEDAARMKRELEEGKAKSKSGRKH